MRIPSLYTSLSTQGTERGRELAKSMMHGKHLRTDLKASAVEQLANVPEPWLERLADENLAYVALEGSETLADTDLLWSYSNESLREDAAKAKPIVESVVAKVSKDLDAEKAGMKDEFQAAMLEHSRPSQTAEALMQAFQKQGLAFAVKVCRELTPVSFLEGEMGVSDAEYSEFLTADESDSKMFREILLELNGPESFADPNGETLKPPSEFLIVPFKMRGGRKVSPISEESYSQISGQEANLHDGVHIWDNRLIILDDDAVNLPAPNAGFHSVMLHETGHAMDYVAETIPELNHRETVDSLYKADAEQAKAGNNRFTSRRAMDNPREYMAEAIEAYLTQKVDDPRDYNKAENNHEALKQKNPELYAYVDKLMNLTGKQLAKPA